MPAPTAEAREAQLEVSFSSCKVRDTNQHGDNRSPLSEKPAISNASYHCSDSQLCHWPFELEIREPVFLILISQNNIRCVLNHTPQSWTLQALMSTQPWWVVMPGGRWFSWFLEVLPALGKAQPDWVPKCCPSLERHIGRIQPHSFHAQAWQDIFGRIQGLERL